MQKLWVGTVLGSAAPGCEAELLILLHKHISCDIISAKTDTKGRFVSAHLHLNCRDLILTNIYAPNVPDKQFYKDVLTHTLKCPQFPYLIGGDFNSTHVPLLD